MMNKRNKMEEIRATRSFDELLDVKYGKVGTKTREKYDLKSNKFRVGELIKEARINANLTQEDVAARTGTKKSYISRIERGKSDIQMSTLIRIIEEGVGRRVNLVIT